MSSVFFFFFNDTATTEIYTLSLHDALPILPAERFGRYRPGGHGCEYFRASRLRGAGRPGVQERHFDRRSEEHTSELQSQSNLVCRLLLAKKNTLCFI